MQPSSSKTVNPKLAFHTLKGSTAQFSIERSVQLTQMGASDMTLMLLVPFKKATFSDIIFPFYTTVLAYGRIEERKERKKIRLTALSILCSQRFLNNRVTEKEMG